MLKFSYIVALNPRNYEIAEFVSANNTQYKVVCVAFS